MQISISEREGKGRLLILVYRVGVIRQAHLEQLGKLVKEYGIDLVALSVLDYPKSVEFFNVDNLPEADLEMVRKLAEKAEAEGKIDNGA